MVAYSFRPRFVPLIETGRKRQTIRADRARHARTAEQVQLYTGMRTKACRMIGRASCVGVGPITIDFLEDKIEVFDVGILHTIRALNGFARDDGFEDWPDMVRFWADNHPRAPERWSGIVVRWGDLLT